ncbi:MAG: VIT1/CCC1 transporter family protein, partial [bacterium]|nr:VIT1/CCC1 transporter family protein [bacterium]
KLCRQGIGLQNCTNLFEKETVITYNSYMASSRPIFLSYVRNFIFGVEDSLVSTVGLLAGLSTADVGRGDIITAGVILIFVEAFSMGSGSFLSERSIEESSPKQSGGVRSVVDAVVMFVSYFLAGLIPLFPYIFWQPAAAFPISIIFTLLALLTLGLLSAKILHTKLLRSAVRMFVIGGVAVFIGVMVGAVLK